MYFVKLIAKETPLPFKYLLFSTSLSNAATDACGRKLNKRTYVDRILCLCGFKSLLFN